MVARSALVAAFIAAVFGVTAMAAPQWKRLESEHFEMYTTTPWNFWTRCFKELLMMTRLP